MLPAFVIGLREGVEAALIIGIIAAFLIQQDRRSALVPMWIGVAAAVALCAVSAVVLDAIGKGLPDKQQEIMEGLLALGAVVGVTYMVLWMRRHSAELKRTLESSAQSALVTGSVWALVLMAFFAVLREGLETAIFMLASFQSTNRPITTGVGAVLGVLAAVALGYAFYKGGVRINLSRFFRVTGFILILVAAGLMSSAVHALSEAGVITQLQGQALNLSAIIPEDSLRESLLTGMLGLRPEPTYAEVLAWFAYLVPMAFIVMRPRKVAPRSRSEVAQPVSAV